MNIFGRMKADTFSFRTLGLLVVLVLAPLPVQAGSLDSPAGPENPASAMYTLEDLYNRLNTGAAGAKRAGVFSEPSSGPGATGHTLDEIMGKAPSMDTTNGATAADVASGRTFWGLQGGGGWGVQTGTATSSSGYPALVPQSGQTVSYFTGDDGDLKKGVASPSPRFTDNGNGTVTDNLTGLIWLKNASCVGAPYSWDTALTIANNLANGACGLTDGSVAGAWRLPNTKELMSLVDFSTKNPALPSGHPFTNVKSANYWTSTTYASATSQAWSVNLYYGLLNGYYVKTYPNAYMWPVRGGQ